MHPLLFRCTPPVAISQSFFHQNQVVNQTQPVLFPSPTPMNTAVMRSNYQKHWIAEPSGANLSGLSQAKEHAYKFSTHRGFMPKVHIVFYLRLGHIYIHDTRQYINSLLIFSMEKYLLIYTETVWIAFGKSASLRFIFRNGK